LLKSIRFTALNRDYLLNYATLDLQSPQISRSGTATTFSFIMDDQGLPF